MKDLNGKILQIAEKEKDLVGRKAALKKKIEKILKAAAAEEERLMSDADRRAGEEKEKMLSESGKRSQEQVRQMLLDAEIEAKREAVIFRQKSEKLISSLFKELEGYFKN
ncbi:MAG: hypothetical protein ABII20_05235 [Candidatus Omnitrophota bacterium]|nr:hypothetical protein [Candidatus Omnitrophota bacterium]MBU3929945.1 hypothetical protein [bacterium]MBU4122669.1 hypothetical protein [bacterium]